MRLNIDTYKTQYEVIKNSNFDENGKSIQFALKSQDKKKNINLALFENIPVSDIKVEPKELIQFVGDTGKLKVTITPDNATDKEVTFTSADPSIMTVDKEGNWVAKAIGNTIITVTTKNGKTDFVRVTVKEIPVDGISVEPKVLDQYVGDTGKLKVTITPDNATNKNVTYTVVDPTIMTIDKDGNWEAKSPGSTMIIVATSNGKLATVQVTVREKAVLPESITVEPKVLDQFVGDTGKLKVTFQPSNTTVKDVTFTSADPSIMTVDKEGNWVAKAPGKTVIIVMTPNGKMDMVNVTVKEKEIPVEGLTVEPSVLDQYVGDTGTLKVILTPDNATNKNVTFTSANPEIMTVDASGNWVAKAVGKTTITVTSSNGKTAVVQVIVREREIPVEGLTVEPSVLDQYVGDTGTLKVTITPNNATNKNVNFISLNPEIMTVDKEGNWVAKAVGKTTIIVTSSNGKTAIVQVTVREKEVPVEGLTVEPSVLDQYVGDTGTLKVTITPNNATNKNVTFTSADPSIMTVDKEGNWVAKAVGKTTITLTSSNGKTAIVQVTVREREIPVEGLTVEPSVLDQYVGDTGTLKVTITPNNATNKNVTFTSADPSIMTVDKEGNWVAKAVGKTTITVTSSNGKTAVVQVTVREREIPVEGLTVEPSVLDQYVGDTGTLKVTITPDNATNKNVTFTSANPEIMTVDKDGNWVAKAVGETTITVTASNGKTAIVKVTVRKKQGVGATFYDYPRYLGYFIEKGVGTATNFDDDYNNVEPYPGLGTDYYKVKKVGYVTVKDTGIYTFSIEVDDNGAVYLDDEKIIDRDNILGGALSNFRHLKAGQTIKITTEHYNKEAPISYFHLRWQTPTNPYTPKAIPDSEITMD